MPRRPALRYLGGKWRLAPWIIEAMPPHRIYVEAFGGGASVLLRKPRVYNETYNDLSDDVVNLFRVLRGPDVDELIRQLELTPYARTEYLAALEATDDPVERARRTVVRSHMAHGTGGVRADRPTGFRRDGVTGTTNVAGEWAGFPEALRAIAERFRGVTIEQRPALDLIDEFDAPGVMIYLDPPYLPETRANKAKKGEGYHTYQHEMTLEDHRRLLERVKRAVAMIVISGYPSPLYDDVLRGWRRRQVDARAYRNAARTEVLWINPPAVAAMPQPDLLATA